MERRLCTVETESGEVEYGYFHFWEAYSEPVAASPLVGGAPAGVFSRVYGIVEFPNEVRRIDPTRIHFI